MLCGATGIEDGRRPPPKRSEDTGINIKIHQESRRRRSIRLKGYDCAGTGGYYVTIVSRGRECLFGEIVDGKMHLNEMGKIVRECWEEISTHFPAVDFDVFVVMPNHLHGIIIIHNNGRQMMKSSPAIGARHASPLPARGVSSHSLGAIIGSFKSAVTRRAGRKLNLANIWQRNYYEHIIRDQTDYERIANYIAINPSKLVDNEENPLKPISRDIIIDRQYIGNLVSTSLAQALILPLKCLTFLNPALTSNSRARLEREPVYKKRTISWALPSSGRRAAN